MQRMAIFFFILSFGISKLCLASDAFYTISNLSSYDKSKTVIKFNIWLKLKNEEQLDQLLADIYSPTSDQYQKFLTWPQFYQKFSPTLADKQTIKKYLIKNGFQILPAKENFYIRAQGSIADIERTFQLQIKKYKDDKKTYYNSPTQAKISPIISRYVNGMSIINRPSFHSKCLKKTEPGGDNFAAIYGINKTIVAKLVDEQGNVIVPNMKFTGFTPNGTNDHGYTPQQIQHAYGVDKLLKRNINGEGQTVFIIDTCNSPTLPNDLQAFTSNNNLLPLVQNQNYFVISYPTGSTAADCTYTKADSISLHELTLDVEGFHTMAPNAIIKIALSTEQEVNVTLTDAIQDSQQGYLISSSHSEPECQVPSIEPALKAAATVGITVNISSGDCGDNTNYYKNTCKKAVNYPSSSTWVTAVGGTSLFLDKNGDYWFETGWGTARNISYVCKDSDGTKCTSYMEQYTNLGKKDGFVDGATGGISSIYPAQPWQQNAIHNLYAGGYGVVGDFIYSKNPLVNYRAVPDISMFATGSYPGFEIYITQTLHGTPTQTYVGGTSLACPLFTGILALLSQERTQPIGLASRFLYDLPAGALHIINNPHGKGNPIAGTPNPNAFQLFQTDPVTGDLQGIVFNFDSSLTLGPIWSDVVGVGSPYAPRFVSALSQQ
jgi:subtilase family serine protease